MDEKQFLLFTIYHLLFTLFFLTKVLRASKISLASLTQAQFTHYSDSGTQR